MAENEEYTSITVMLIPEESDPIVAASSEPAHMTVVWMGESEDLSEEQIQAIVDEVRAYAAELDGPIFAPVAERGALGDEDADVIFLEATDSLLAMRDGLFQAAPAVKSAHDGVEQYPDWTPHVTLGYPETPARQEYAGDQVAFDRIGVWVGAERHNFVMGTRTSEESVTAAAFDMAGVIADVDDDLDRDEMPVDEPEEGEEIITQIPVHGIAVIEGRATGDGRGFRVGAIDVDAVPQPLGFEFESSHGGDNSRVAVVGHIAEMERVPFGGEEGVYAIRWRGYLNTGMPYTPQALEGIIDGSYTGMSVIVDSIEVDVEEQRDQMRERLLKERSSTDGEREMDSATPEMSEEDIEDIIDMMIGDGAQEVTWFTSARQRRLDMVPTGAFIEAFIALGHEFADELTEEQLVASAQALEDCGCLQVEDVSGDPLTNARAALEAESFREISAEERKRLAKEGKALPDGSFPIANVDDLRNAIQAIGRAKDPAKAKAHIKKRAKDLGQDGLIPEGWGLSVMERFAVDVASGSVERGGMKFAPGTKDGPGWITHPIPTARIRRYWVRGKGAAKIRWGVPGDFNRCRMQLAKYVQNPEWLAGLCANMHKEAIGVWPGQESGGRHSLAASAAPLFSLVAAPTPVDAALFQNPNLSKPTGIVVDGERIYGHIASWDMCHIGEPEGPGKCTLAPHSATDYAHFRTGTVHTTEGPVAVGSITMGTGHASGRLRPVPAAAHYDNTGSVIADVACGEDRHGIWFSGRIRPGTSDDDLYALQASGRLSGDWRKIGGNYELVAALVVNVPGYPIPATSLAASGEMGGLSLVAAGIVESDDQDEPVLVAAGGWSVPAEITSDLAASDLIPRDQIAAAATAAVEAFILRTKRAEELNQARDILATRLRADARDAFAKMEV